jgi:hypothetical protein
VSEKATLVKASSGLGFVIVNVRVDNVDAPANTIGLGANTLSMLGGSMAVNEAVADPPEPVFAPVSVDEINPLMLICGPAVVAVTVIPARVQLVPAASVPPVKLIVSGAVVVNDPPQVATGPLVATVNPAGNVSLKARPVNAAYGFGLSIANVSREVPPTAIGSVAKVFEIVGYSGVPQPVITTLSNKAIADEVCWPTKFMRKAVVLVPVTAAPNGPTVIQGDCFLNPFVATRLVNAPPSALL